MIVSIVSSVTVEFTQADGTIHVSERHTDHLGNVYHRGPWVADGHDIPALLAAHAVELAEQLANAEFEHLIGAD